MSGGGALMIFDIGYQYVDPLMTATATLLLASTLIYVARLFRTPPPPAEPDPSA